MWLQTKHEGKKTFVNRLLFSSYLPKAAAESWQISPKKQGSKFGDLRSRKKLTDFVRSLKKHKLASVQNLAKKKKKEKKKPGLPKSLKIQI